MACFVSSGTLDLYSANTVYCNSYHDKYNCLWWILIMRSLTLWWKLIFPASFVLVGSLFMLSATLLWHGRNWLNLQYWLWDACSFCVYWSFLHADRSMPFCFYFVQPEEQKEDFSHLPPSQQEKRLKLKIDELKSSYAKELAARFGLSCSLIVKP